jgi:hypothetical protein
MQSIGTVLGRRRHLVTVFALMAACAAGQAGIANAAPTFDVTGYESCTATAVPTPDQSFDSLVTACCVQHAGVPADTKYGVGCVAATDNTSEDFRPTIVLPIQPQSADGAPDPSALDGMNDLPIPEPG